MKHMIARSNEDEGFTTLDTKLILLAQSSIAAIPGMGTFDHPAARQDLKAVLVGGTLDNLQLPAHLFLEPPGQRRTVVATVGPNVAEARQVRAVLLQGLCDQLGATAVVHVSGGDDHFEQQALGID